LFFHDYNKSIEKCKNLPDEFENSCLYGLGYFIGLKKLPSRDVKLCDNIPTELKKSCLIGLEAQK
jgi:uncharacterized protein YutD